MLPNVGSDRIYCQIPYYILDLGMGLEVNCQKGLSFVSWVLGNLDLMESGG